MDGFDPERVRMSGFGGCGECGEELQALGASISIEVATQDGCSRDHILELGSREITPVDLSVGNIQLKFKAPCSSMENCSTLGPILRMFPGLK